MKAERVEDVVCGECCPLGKKRMTKYTQYVIEAPLPEVLLIRLMRFVQVGEPDSKGNRKCVKVMNPVDLTEKFCIPGHNSFISTYMY